MENLEAVRRELRALVTRQEFKSLVYQIDRDTGFQSNPRYQMEHPGSLEIIAHPEKYLQLLFQELRDAGGWWFYHLEKMTGHEIRLPKECDGHYESYRQAWLNWGKEHGYLDKNPDAAELAAESQIQQWKDSGYTMIRVSMQFDPIRPCREKDPSDSTEFRPTYYDIDDPYGHEELVREIRKRGINAQRTHLCD